MKGLAQLEGARTRPIWDGVVARAVYGERITLAVVELEPNAFVPEHRHPNEQLGVVLEGSVRFRAGEEAELMGPGGTWRVLADVPHEARAGPRGAVVVEVFAPTRADWDAVQDESPRPPRWPA